MTKRAVLVYNYHTADRKRGVYRMSKECKEQFSRSERLLGAGATEMLARASVLLVGVGGVGGHAAEALARAGVGKITLVDSDVVSLSNINRQIIALHSTVGRAKTEVAKERILDINPSAEVTALQVRYTPEGASEVNLSDYDYVIDAIDDVGAKVALIKNAADAGVPIISSMGTGNKLDPTLLTVTDISKTEYDPLAKAVRTRLRKLGINHLKVVFSPEQPRAILPSESGKPVPASVPFVPSVAGIMMAGEVIKDLVKIK